MIQIVYFTLDYADYGDYVAPVQLTVSCLPLDYYRSMFHLPQVRNENDSVVSYTSLIVGQL